MSPEKHTPVVGGTVERQKIPPNCGERSRGRRAEKWWACGSWGSRGGGTGSLGFESQAEVQEFLLRVRGHWELGHPVIFVFGRLFWGPVQRRVRRGEWGTLGG